MFDFVLLASDRRALVSEIFVHPGELYETEELGDLGARGGIWLVCKYFTGRSVLTQVLRYAPENIYGKYSCPFLVARDWLTT